MKACPPTTTSGPSERGAFTFVQLCDPQLGMGGYEHDVKSFRQAVTQINALNPDFVLICGDMVDNPDEKSFADFGRIRGALSVPSYCVPGNHDIGNEATAESLRVYREAIGKDYYAFEHKGCVFVCVNTQLWKSPLDGESDRQDDWFEATLDAAGRAGAGIIVVGHYAPYGEAPEEADGYYNLPSARRKWLLDRLQGHGVAAMLTGHTHRPIVHAYNGILLVTGESTSVTHRAPLGFRLWRVTDAGALEHESVPLEGAQVGQSR